MRGSRGLTIGKGGRDKGAGDVCYAHSGFSKMRYEVALQALWQESVRKDLPYGWRASIVPLLIYSGLQ